MPYVGEISALGAALLWGMTAFIFTEVTHKVGATLVNVTRLFVGEIFIALTCLIFRVNTNISGEQIIYLLISGLLGLVVGDGSLFKAFKTIGPRIAILFLSLSPAITSILAYIFLGETMTMYAIAGVFVAMGGISLVVLTEKKEEKSRYKITPTGLFYCFMGALGQGIGSIFVKKASLLGHIDPFFAIGIRIFAALIILLPIVFALNLVKKPFLALIHDKKSIRDMLVGSFFGPYISIALSFVAFANTQVGIASTLTATTPIFMLPMSHFIMHEKLNRFGIIGSIITVGGVALLFVK